MSHSARRAELALAAGWALFSSDFVMLGQRLSPHSSTNQRIFEPQEPRIISSETPFAGPNNAPMVAALSMPDLTVSERKPSLLLSEVRENPTRELGRVLAVWPSQL